MELRHEMAVAIERRLNRGVAQLLLDVLGSFQVATRSGPWLRVFMYGPPLQNFVRLPAGGFGYFLSVSLYFATISNMGSSVHPNSAATSKSSCGSISMLNTFGYPAMGALAENMPGWRCGPVPVGCTSVKYMRHCFQRAATISAPMKVSRPSRLPVSLLPNSTSVWSTPSMGRSVVISAARDGVQPGSTRYCVKRRPSRASWSMRGVGAPRSSPRP